MIAQDTLLVRLIRSSIVSLVFRLLWRRRVAAGNAGQRTGDEKRTLDPRRARSAARNALGRCRVYRS
jgi:hypothetical protein